MFNWIPGGFAKEISRTKFLMMSVNYIGWQLPFFRGYLSNSNGTSVRRPSKGSDDTLPYQFFGAIYNQRHKRYILKDSSNIFDVTIPSISPLSYPTLTAKSEDKGGPVRESGGRLGRLDAANEAGLFHKINKARLEKIKKSLKDVPLGKQSTADPAKSEEK